MGVARRIVFPILWLVVFAVIAAALFKLAFFDGLSAQAETQVPAAALQTATVQAVRGSITNTVDVQGSVVSDPAVAVRSTADGMVVYLDVEPGDRIEKGERLFQVRKPLEEQLAPQPAAEEDSTPAPVAPRYTYIDVTATAAGTLVSLPVLLNQQVSIGTEIASIDPGTYSVQGTLTTDQQFRIMDRPNTAEVAINGGPAPFACSDVTMGKTTPAADGISTQAQAQAQPAVGPPAAGQGSGTVSCSVPADVSVFAGLGAAITITAGQSLDAVTVPTTAVQGAVQNGVVWVVTAPGASEERPVTLGLTDGQVVEIAEGLSEGEEILLFVPGAEAPQDGQQMMYGPGVMGG